MARARLVCPMLLLVALAGCLGQSPQAEDTSAMPEDDAFVLSILEGTWDPASVSPWYQHDTDTLAGPRVLRIVNDDVVFHQIIGALEPPVDPVWTEAYHAHTDSDEGGHDHGAPHDHSASGGHGVVLFDISVEPGEWKDVDVTADGNIAIHCHPHPWMVDSLTALPAGPQDYAVVQDRLVATGALDGTQTADVPAVDVTTQVAAPDLVTLTATLTWNDAEDDGPLGEASNDQDTFRLSLVGPDGSVMAEGEQTARNGALTVTYDAPALPWPETVTASGLVDADQGLRGLDSYDGSGTWAFHVELVSAPGYADLPAGYDTWSAVPGTDGQQSWQLAVEAVHGWGAVGSAAHEVTASLSLTV